MTGPGGPANEQPERESGEDPGETGHCRVKELAPMGQRGEGM